MLDAAHNSYEKMTFYKAPRARSKKLRAYTNIDLTKEFEFRKQVREADKQTKLEELYQRHDSKASGMKDLLPISDVDRTNLTDE